MGLYEADALANITGIIGVKGVMSWFLFVVVQIPISATTAYGVHEHTKELIATIAT